MGNPIVNHHQANGAKMMTPTIAKATKIVCLETLRYEVKR
jgi:hypothetical protein